MRMGPGKHLQGRVLMNGLVKAEEFDSFHEVAVVFTHRLLVSDGDAAHHHTRTCSRKSERLWRWYVGM